MSCPQIWNIEQEKDRKKREKAADQRKGDGDLEREIKTTEKFFCWKNNMIICSSGNKMRNASGHQCKKKMSGSEKKCEREHVRHFLHKNVFESFTL